MLLQYQTSCSTRDWENFCHGKSTAASVGNLAKWLLQKLAAPLQNALQGNGRGICKLFSLSHAWRNVWRNRLYATWLAAAVKYYAGGHASLCTYLHHFVSWYCTCVEMMLWLTQTTWWKLSPARNGVVVMAPSVNWPMASQSASVRAPAMAMTSPVAMVTGWCAGPTHRRTARRVSWCCLRVGFRNTSLSTTTGRAQVRVAALNQLHPSLAYKLVHVFLCGVLY